MSAAVPPAASVPSVEQRVLRLIVDHLGMPDDVRLEESLRDDIGADSLDRIELLMAVEQEFGIEVPDADAEAMVRVCDVVAFVERAVRR